MKAPYKNPTVKTVPCRTCGRPTTMLGTQKCDTCWNIEARLEEYLRSPGGRARIAGLMGQAGYRVTPLDQDEERAVEAEAEEAGLFVH